MKYGAAVYAAFAVLIGGFAWACAACFDFVLWAICGVDVPWWLDLIAGLVSSSVVIPAWVIGMALKFAGVDLPLWPVSP